VNRPTGSSQASQNQVFSAGNDRIDPTRAASGVARWRRGLSETLGEDPGASLDRPDRRLAMLKVFGSTSRLADLCLKHPAAAADAMIEGPSPVLAQAARDLSALSNGVGGAEALHGALLPIKNRADLAIGIAELMGAWTVSQATAARTDLAERLVETAVTWLMRGAANRGELGVTMKDGYADGVFVLAGADFAHEDLSPYGPLELAVIYDEAEHTGPAARMAERAFVRIGAELREAFEGKPGEYPLYHLRTPLGSGVNGAGYVENLARATAAVNDPQSSRLRQWVGAARVIAGDRQRGGVFLEDVEPIVWGDDLVPDETMRADILKASDDPRSVFRNIANFLRWRLGRTRPLFRTASAREVFETAAESGVIQADRARRLVAGGELAQIIVSRAQLMKGASPAASMQPDEEQALAALCGFHDYASLASARDGVIADARSTLQRFVDGAKSDFERYRAADKSPDDIDKLEDLGFRDGAGLSNVIDRWTKLSMGREAQRFSALAPGLLTAFGETQHPDEAVRLFDRIIKHAADDRDVFAKLEAEEKPRNALVDAIGCFGEAVAPITESGEGARIFLEVRGAEIPVAGEEWLARHAPPSSASDLDAIAGWRRESIARIALYAAAGDMNFSAAAECLEAVHNKTLEQIHAHAALDHKIGETISLHVFDGPARGLPGAESPLGFVASGGDANAREDDGAEAAREAFARQFLDSIEALGEGVFALSPNVAYRSGGVAGPLAPDLAQFKSYIQSEAVAHDQILLSRARVIAGGDRAREKTADALRGAISNPKRADILFRDLDRARAQRLRRDRAGSTWDLHYIEGGLFDTDLIISTLIYRHAAAQPGVQNVRPPVALDLLERSGLIPADVSETLKSAHAFWTRLATAQALARWSDPQREPVRRRFASLLARAAEVERFNQVRPIMHGYADEVSRLYAQLVLGRPSLSLVSNG